jgi:hypothetical protein
MEKLNGYKIVGVLPKLRGIDIQEYVILGQTTGMDGFEYVTAFVPALDASVTSWHCGNYFDNLPDALVDLNERAELYATV